MTWDELTQLLTELADDYDIKVNINRAEGPETVMLHLVPVAWFCSMKFTGELNIGVYEREDNRLVGKEHLPLAELTPEFVRERVGQAAREQFGLCLDPEAVRDFLERFPRPQMRDMEGAG